jgi:hypothetical protein
MKRIIWLVIVFLFLIPQTSALGFSSYKSTLSASPNGGNELNILQPIQIHVPAETTAQNAPDAYPSHPRFPLSLGQLIEKAPITIADINSDGSCV